MVYHTVILVNQQQQPRRKENLLLRLRLQLCKVFSLVVCVLLLLSLVVSLIFTWIFWKNAPSPMFLIPLCVAVLVGPIFLFCSWYVWKLCCGAWREGGGDQLLPRGGANKAAYRQQQYSFQPIPPPLQQQPEAPPQSPPFINQSPPPKYSEK